jgi:hypothetical protein
VFQVRSAARRGERVDYTLTISITGGVAAHSPSPAAADGLQESAGRAGEGRFNATGTVPCAQHAGQPMGQCAFGVARAGGGTATVVVTHPDGRKRAIFFERGRATGANISQADGDVRFSVQREADLNMIRIGNERYEIPDAAVFGG